MLRCLGLSHMGGLIFLPFCPPPMERVPPSRGHPRHVACP